MNSPPLKALGLIACLNALLLSGPHLIAGSPPLALAFCVGICSAWLFTEGAVSRSNHDALPVGIERYLWLAGGLSVPLTFAIAAGDYQLHWATELVGSISMLLGANLRVRAARQLAESYGDRATVGAVLHEVGVYRWSRHPSELGLLLLVLGIALFWGSALAVLMGLAAALFGLARTLIEERALGLEFGAAYRRYRQNVFRYAGRKP